MTTADPNSTPAQPTSSSANTTAPDHNPADAARYAYARAILGPHLFDRVASANLLVVGAGGIGCELLKNLVLVGFGNIEIVDLDTIDLSNLNRQFLFQKQHIKKPKSIVAKQTASSFNPLVNITAHHANIKEERFNLDYFQRFDIVLNALDNLDARRWVNRMCIAANVPLVESGTTGFLGQVQPILKDVTECYDCTAKPVPKTFPVCTIRSTPSTPIHCIVWAKSWLFVQLFGADDETEEQELDKAVADGEDADEIDTLRKEAREMRDIRAAMLDAAKEVAAAAAAAANGNGNGNDDVDGDGTAAQQPPKKRLDEAARRVFAKVYNADIRRLLGMEEMWKHRPVKPVPLDYDEASKAVEGDAAAPAAADEAQREAAKKHKTSLKDQRHLSLAENVDMFASSLTSLAIRAASDPSTPLSFDKDDSDALDFITSSSNLRSHVYGIEEKTRFQVKEMAGNIIPAIASTNAIISGVLVLQALHLLRARWSCEEKEEMKSKEEGGVGKAKYVTLARTSQRMLTCLPPAPPNEACGVCRDVYIPLRLDPSTITLGQILQSFVLLPRSKGGLGLSDNDGEEGEEVGIETYESTRLLSDPDFEDNLSTTLEALGVGTGKMLTIKDEEALFPAINLVVSSLREGENGLVLPAPSSLPVLVKKPSLPTPPPAEDEEEEEDEVVEVKEVVDGGEEKRGTKRIAETAQGEEGEGEGERKRKRLQVEGGEGEEGGKKAKQQGGGSEGEAIEIE